MDIFSQETRTQIICSKNLKTILQNLYYLQGDLKFPLHQHSYNF